MFTADAREALIKELVRREVKEDLGVELEDLLNPIKVVSLETKILKAEMELAGGVENEERRQQLVIGHHPVHSMLCELVTLTDLGGPGPHAQKPRLQIAVSLHRKFALPPLLSEESWCGC